MAILFRDDSMVFDGSSIVFLEGDPANCKCCEPPPTHSCVRCHTCCFSNESSVSLSLTVQTSLNEDWCLCEVGQDANGDVPFAGLSFDGSFVLWTTWQDADPSVGALGTCHDDEGDITWYKHVDVHYLCEEGSTQAAHPPGTWEIAVYWIDDSGGLWVLTAGAWGQGDCCGANVSGDSAPPDGCGSFTSNGSVALQNNECCFDTEEEECVHGDGDCASGDCDEEEGI